MPELAGFLINSASCLGGFLPGEFAASGPSQLDQLRAELRRVQDWKDRLGNIFDLQGIEVSSSLTNHIRERTGLRNCDPQPAAIASRGGKPNPSYTDALPGVIRRQG